MRALKLFLFVALSALSPLAAADVELPRAVPVAKLTQQVGLTEIGVEYDCPATMGRKIWGGVVPYDKIWTIASNPAARIKFSRDVGFGDRTVPAGTYWMLAIPSKSAWTVIVNRSVEPIASARDYKPELDVARVKVTPRSVPRRERLVFSFSEITDERASLDLEWEALRISIPIQVNTTQQVLSSINGLDGAWRSFANAARYMLETKRDYDAGLKYVDDALALKEDWYAMWVKGALFAAKGNYEAASDWAVKARELAQKAGNGAYLEVDLAKAVAEWSKKAHRLDKEARPTVKVGAESPVADGARAPAQPSLAPATFEPASEHVVGPTAPPELKPAADQEALKTPAAPASTDPLRRARLRRR